MTQQAVTARNPQVSARDRRAAWAERFEALASTREGQPRWVSVLRQAALAHFTAFGFPTIREEDWKYTSVAAIEGAEFQVEAGALPRVSNESLARVGGSESWSRYVFVEGVYSLESSPGRLPYFTNLGDSLQTDAEVERTLGQLVPFGTSGFSALNTAFFRDGAVISIPAGVQVGEPIHLVFLSSRRDVPFASHPRNLVILGPGSSATLVETYLGRADGQSLTNAVTEVVLGEGASLSHSKVVLGEGRTYHVGATAVRQGRGSAYTSVSLATGGELIRNDLRLSLQEEGADCTLLGLYLVNGAQHIDNHTVIDHAAPHGTSRQLYKGILDDRARGVFSGKIYVRPGAQRTDAHQTNKNLLLSPDAAVDTKPQLEILADDVKCSHGATVGQLDPEMVFYLKSRGLSLDTSRALLTYGFAADAIEPAKPESVRSYLAGLLADRLGADPGVAAEP